MTQLKEQIKSPVTNPKEMETYEILDNKLGRKKKVILRKLSKLLQNADRKLNKIRNITHEQMRS